MLTGKRMSRPIPKGSAGRTNTGEFRNLRIGCKRKKKRSLHWGGLVGPRRGRTFTLFERQLVQQNHKSGNVTLGKRLPRKSFSWLRKTTNREKEFVYGCHVVGAFKPMGKRSRTQLKERFCSRLESGSLLSRRGGGASSSENRQVGTDTNRAASTVREEKEGHDCHLPAKGMKRAEVGQKERI